MRNGFTLFILCLLIAGLSPPSNLDAASWTLDERPAKEREWGYRPADQTDSEVNPPNFSWRADSKSKHWEIQCASDPDFTNITYHQAGLETFVHTPASVFDPGTYYWRYRGVDADGKPSQWSVSREFTLREDALPMPMPGRADLLARIPDTHPRLFMRPEDLPELRKLASTTMSDEFDRLLTRCEKILKNPPPTDEPAKYGDDVVRLSEAWRKLWWGNRTYTTNALESATTLAFAWRLGGNEDYANLAKQILLDCAKWDPKGATGFRYNDEAGMPYAYYFSRAYTFLNDRLSESEKQVCRDMMRIRGNEMYRHLNPGHLRAPYSSHGNRAWHFLGEIGIAFHGEIPEADDWLWFAMNVFYNTYPVWSDDDGGWHEGTIYWKSYMARFTWWADIMQSAMAINAYDKPYLQRIGFYPLYLMPPGKVGGGFGDLNGRVKSSQQVPLIRTLAQQAGNSYWQWYVDAHDGGVKMAEFGATNGYVAFLRNARDPVEAKPPTDLPGSRVFRGTGQAFMNTTLLDADEDVQVVFKSSPFGTQSHGYEANNSFLLWAYGQRLLLRSGRRDIYGSAHHKKWMWSTRSVNNITVDGKEQMHHSANARGEIVDFQTTPLLDVVVGEASAAYRIEGDEDDPSRVLDRFTRAIVFVKPDLVLVYDSLAARKPSQFTYWLHAVNEFQIPNQREIVVTAGDVQCDIDFLAPEGLQLSQTDQYDPNPRDRVKLREWHLTAETAEPQATTEFVTLYRPHRSGDTVPKQATLTRVDDGYSLNAEIQDGRIEAFLPVADSDKETIQVRRWDAEGNEVETVEARFTKSPTLVEID